MGVDFYACDSCGESRYSEFVGSCTSCSHRLCTSCLVNDEIDSRYASNYGIEFNGSEEQMEQYGIEEGDYEIGDIIDDTYVTSTFCPFCTGEEVSDDDLLEYLLKKFSIKKDDLVQEYLENR